MAESSDAVVIGAGIAGASTALALRRRGLEVTLVDAHEPGHARAASAGDHRILRASHGSDEFYTRWSREARLRWLELGAEAGASRRRRSRRNRAWPGRAMDGPNTAEPRSPAVFRLNWPRRPDNVTRQGLL